MSSHISHTDTALSDLALRTSVCNYLYFPFYDAKCRRALSDLDLEDETFNCLLLIERCID